MKLPRVFDKTILLVMSVVMMAGLVVPGAVFAFEAVGTFNTDITVHKDASFAVVERITYDFDSKERHGIFREIPLIHPQSASSFWQDRYVEITDITVTLDGASVPYDVSTTKQAISIKIGDPNTTLTGVHEYVLSYTVVGGLSYYPDENPELYWNVTGHEWPVPILRADVVLHDPDGIFNNLRSCYRGFEGEANSCTDTSTSTQTSFASLELAPGEGMTVAQSLDGAKVDKVILERFNSVIAIALLLFGVLAAAAIFAYRFKTKYKPDEPIVAQYEPYPGVLPMYTGVLMDGRLDPRDITAGLLYLAQEGFLKIKKTDRKVLFLFEVDDYEITLLKDIDQAPTNFHEEIIWLLFGASPENTTVKLSELKQDMSKQRANAKRLSKLRTAIAEDVIERGFYEQFIKTPHLIFAVVALLLGAQFLIPFLGMVLTFIHLTPPPPGVLILLFIVLVFVPIVLAATMYKRRTRRGYEALNHLKGFKDFLSVTDKERFTFHNAPSKSPEQFMEYLPYAVALGVEKEWAEVFSDITIPQPEWYDGGATTTAFSATALTHDLGSFSGAFVGATGSSPSSGSSGGGFSGGGAGGGGGGSW